MNRQKGRERMKNRIKGLFLAIIMMLSLLSLQIVQVHATGNVHIPVSQTFTLGRAEDPTSVNRVFTYTLIPDVATNPMPTGTVGGAYSFTLNGNEDINIDLSTTYTGSNQNYTYKLKQTVGGTAHYQYDEKIYDVQVYVIQAAGVVHTGAIIEDSGDKVERAEFKAGYSEPTPVTVDPPVKKIISGDRPTVVPVFTFKMEAMAASNPMPTGSNNGVKTTTIQGEGESEFGEFEITRAGTYVYRLSEIDTQERDYTYDTTKYTLTFMVHEENGQLVADKNIVNDKGQEVYDITFTNNYHAPQATVKTGDRTKLLIWAILLAMASFIFGILFITKKNRNVK